MRTKSPEGNCGSFFRCSSGSSCGKMVDGQQIVEEVGEDEVGQQSGFWGRQLGSSTFICSFVATFPVGPMFFLGARGATDEPETSQARPRRAKHGPRSAQEVWTGVVFRCCTTAVIHMGTARQLLAHKCPEMPTLPECYTASLRAFDLGRILTLNIATI